MKFDYCISNPPYQANTFTRQGGVAEAQNIFHIFYQVSLVIAGTTTMIFPGGRWMQGGDRKAQQSILPTVWSVWWYPNGASTPQSKKVFDNANINDGISIVISHNSKNIPLTIELNGVKINRPKEGELLPLTSDAATLLSKLPLAHNIMHRRATTGVFGLRTYFVARNPDKVVAVDMSPAPPSQFAAPIKAYLGNDTPGSGKIAKLYWIDSTSVPDWDKKNRRALAKQWKIVMSQGGANKNPEIQRIWVVPAEIIVGETLNVLAAFDTRTEAENFCEYLNTSLCRFLMFLSKGGHTRTLGLFIPDLEDYTDNNQLFAVDEQLPAGNKYRGLSLEQRLQVFFGLTVTEIDLVKTHMSNI